MSFWALIKVWLAYSLPLFPFMPEVGERQKVDSILIQSFGRNTWDDKSLLGWLASIRRAMGEGDIPMFQYLKGHGFDPGCVNKGFAEYALGVIRAHGEMPIYAQWEVAYCIWLKLPRMYHLVRASWPTDEYFSTMHVFSDLAERMRSYGYKRALLITHQAMAARALMIAWKCGIDASVDRMQWPPRARAWWEWDAKSVQPWTRKFGFGWLIRECVARFAHHPLKHWVRFIPPKF